MKKLITILTIIIGCFALPITASAATQSAVGNLQAGSSFLGGASDPQNSSTASLLQPANSDGGDSISLNNTGDAQQAVLGAHTGLTKQEIMSEADNQPTHSGSHWLAVTLYVLVGIAVLLAGLSLINYFANRSLEPAEVEN